jgi:hypothetical protein
MHELPLRDDLTRCMKRIFAKLLVSPQHGDTFLAFARGDRGQGAGRRSELSGEGDVRRDYYSEVDKREMDFEYGGGHKRTRSQDETEIPANKRQSIKGAPQGAKRSRASTASHELEVEALFQEVVGTFYKACFSGNGAAAEGAAKIRRSRGVLVACCIVSEFMLERSQDTGSKGVRVHSNVAATTLGVIDGVVNGRPIADMASSGDLVLLLQALRMSSGFKLNSASTAQLCSLLERCILVCTPAGAATGTEAARRELLLEMISTLSSSCRLPASQAPVDFFFAMLRSSDEGIFTAALRHLPALILRCPGAAASVKDIVSLLRTYLQAPETSSTIKAQIPAVMARLLCAICAIQSVDGDTDRAVRCEAPAGMASCDPVENFRTRQSSFSEASARNFEDGSLLPGRSVLHEAPGREIWCCGDVCAARYGSAAAENTLPVPFLSQRGSAKQAGKCAASEEGRETSAVRNLAARIFDLFCSVLKGGPAQVDAGLLKSLLWALPVVVLHLPDQSLFDARWLLDCCLQIASGPGRCLELRLYAAAAIAGFASGSGRWLMVLSGHQTFVKACDTVIDRVRDVYANLRSDGDAEVEYKAAGCIQVQAFMGASINVRNLDEGSYTCLQMICSDLVTAAVQNLADGNFRKSCATYGALEFVAAARGMMMDDLLAHSSCREDIIVNFINCMAAADADSGGEAPDDMRLIRAYLNLFGDGTGQGLGDDDECCRRFLETIFKDVAHLFLMESSGKDGTCKPLEFVARYLQVEPGHLLVQNLQYIIKSLFFANVNPKNTAKVERAKKMIREYTGSDAQEHTRDQPICSEFLLRNVFYEVAQYTKEVDKTKGRQMIRDLCCWLSHAKAIDAKADTQPLEVILSIPSQQDFYTKWMFELNRMCFEEGKLDNGSSDEIRRKR